MRFYDLLLHLYPRSFRDEYGGEMRAVFERSRREASGAGPPRCGSAAMAEVVGNAALVHLDMIRQDVGYRRPRAVADAGLRRSPPSIVGAGHRRHDRRVLGHRFRAASARCRFPSPTSGQDMERTRGYGSLELSPANYRDWTAVTRRSTASAIYTGDAAISSAPASRSA